MTMRNKKKWARVMACALAVAVAGSVPISAAATSSDTNSSQEMMGTPPDGAAPDGEAPTGTPPEKPDGDNGSAPSGEAPVGGFGGGANTQSFDYSGTYAGALVADGEEVTSDGENISTETSDENAALAENGGVLTITNGTLSKSGSDDDGDRCNFYGVNSILLSVGEDSKAYVADTSLTADSTGSNAIFATDSGTVYANQVKINTSADNARGLDATYGGTIVANLMEIETLGDHCAAIATDRGGGSISTTNSTLTTGGSGSPLLYSTGDIQVSNVTGTASGSQIAGMEGLNTILIYNSTLESTITEATASDPVANGVIIYQSTSGDAETTTGERATFNAVNSSLSSSITSGSMFYVTNTTANIVLKDTELSFDSENVNLLQIEGNDANNWGTAGANGGTVTMSAYGEILSGDISVDTISALDLYLLDNTSYTGAMTITENAVNTNATETPITVNLSSDSAWVLTADTTISALHMEDGATLVDADGKQVSIVVDGSEAVSGDSDLTLTVTGTYDNEVTTNENNEVSDDYIDRSDFDSYYGTETGFTTLSVAAVSDETAEVEAADEEATVSADTSKEITGGLIAIIVIGLGAILGICAFLLKKKK